MSEHKSSETDIEPQYVELEPGDIVDEDLLRIPDNDLLRGQLEAERDRLDHPDLKHGY